MRIALSIDGDVLERARDLAARRGSSLNQMIRDYLAALISDQDVDEVLAELERLWSQGGDSKGAKWTSEELHSFAP